MKSFLLLLTLFLFTACDLFESQEQKAQKVALEKAAFEKKVADSKTVQLKKLSAQTKRELALLESKKELALIEKNRELEKIRLASELEKQRITLEQDAQRAVFDQKIKHNDQINNMELKRYLVLILGLLALLGSFFIFYYFKKRREDKLRAYNDNLEKYFHQKENDARVKIAEKILDTIASGGLNREQENQLISAFSATSQTPTPPQLLEDISEDLDIEVEEKK